MIKKKEIIFVVFITVIAIFINLAQTIFDVAITPAGKVFPLVHNYVADYYVYLSLMRQGWEGMWLATSRFTVERFAPQFISVWLLFLGHLARLSGFTLPVVYTLARISGGLALVSLTYFISVIVYPSSPIKRIISLLLVIFGTFFWGWQNGPVVPTLTHLWTELDPLVRFSYIPHHFWAKVFMAAAFVLLMIQTEKKNPSALFFTAIFVILSGLSSPVALATFLPAIFLWMSFELGKGLPVLPWLVAAVVALILSLYSRGIEIGVFPWNSYAPWEEGVRYPVTVFSYFQSLGPNFILFIIAIFFSKRKSSAWSLLIAWAVSGWVMVFGLGKIFPIANIRFLEGYQFIPLSIIATEGIFLIAEKLSQGEEKNSRGFIILTMILLIAYAGVGFYASMNEHLRYLANDIQDSRIYLSQSRMEALVYLGKIVPPQAVVLAPLEISSLIPSFTGARVIAGHALYTYHADEKEKDLANFYSYEDLQLAKNILNKYSVSLVWSNNDQLPNSQFIKSIGLTQIFSNHAATIYRID